MTSIEKRIIFELILSEYRIRELYFAEDGLGKLAIKHHEGRIQAYQLLLQTCFGIKPGFENRCPECGELLKLSETSQGTKMVICSKPKFGEHFFILDPDR